MSLTVNTLADALKTVFENMKDNRAFATGFAEAVADYAGSGTVTTADAGTVSAGEFVGAGTGALTCSAALCGDIVYAACEAMNTMPSGGNEYLAAQMALGIDTMIAGGTVETDVSGTVTPPSGIPAPLSGTAEGGMTGIPAPMEAAFLSAFLAMNGMTEGGNDYLAGQCASAVDAYLKAAAVKTSGEGALSGSTGAGTMA
jgi:hypothetical protein